MKQKSFFVKTLSRLLFEKINKTSKVFCQVSPWKNKIQIKGKIFALSSLKQWEMGNPSVNLKCNPDLAKEWRLQYEAIQPGFHMNKNHWNTVAINTTISSLFLKEMIDLSYNLVFNSLTKKVQKEVLI